MKSQITKTVKVVALIATGILVAFGLTPLSAAAQNQVVTVGTEGVYAPFTFIDAKGVLTGFDVEVVKEIAKRINIEVKFVPTPWDSMFLALDSRKFDMVANEIGKNAARIQKYNFSDSYMTAGAMIIVRGDRSGDFSNGLMDLKGLKVGTNPGSNYTRILEEFNAQNGNPINIKYYEGNVATILQDVVAGRLDATVNERLTVAFNKQNLGVDIKAVGKILLLNPVHFLFRKDAQGETLMAQFNQGLAGIRQDGTLAKLSQKWFGADYTK
ncbi:MAG: transporter substrate-binding domain-containing protein [Holophaga sp.]|jgi:L-cystine transport system substrate-binding protein